MEQDYDSKFEEMKKYIPFLERMIKRLESNSTTSGNPRQAQLAKIRSLRDLLLDKKKRMKMENLLKCEQVLINLYAKVEQRDCFPELKNDIDTSLGTQNEELNLVRNKLKNVVSHFKGQETLPEIARASNTEEACTVGSKEPALFQRRPNKTSLSPPRATLNNNVMSTSSLNNRSYSRVLISPEHDTNWSHENTSDKPLYSRRSPRRTPKKSPRRRLSSPHKKERKKSINQSQIDNQTESNEPKDFNITLKVPEASLNSLNTKDIVSRIINCNDNDVDIDTLRGLRTQILSELKQTGAKDDISDLILQSYKSKKEIGKKEEIEEGELSDSESEIIESIYGNLVIVDKEQKNTSATKKSDSKDDESRKIQICLVINSEKEKQSEADKCNDTKSPVIEESDFESFKDSKSDSQNLVLKKKCLSNIDIQGEILSEVECSNSVKNKETVPSATHSNMSVSESSKTCVEAKNVSNTKSDSLESFTPKPFVTAEQSKKILTTDNTNLKIEENKSDVNEISKKQNLVEIPLLDIEAKQVVHEIDILQALKNEILSEKMSLDDSGTVTPPLHQPKVTKVANMHGMITKKRISIEKYKEKVTATSKPCLFPNQTKIISLNEELLKKQSLKLTEKEYERFNLSNRLAFEESSEDEEADKKSPTIEDVYADLAPKSPDHEDFADTGIKPPVIIPADPVKNTVVVSKADVDMRMPPCFSPSLNASKLDIKKDAATTSFEKESDVSNSEAEINSNEKRLPFGDPRVRREFNIPLVDTATLGSIDRNPRALISFPPNITPNMKPNVISNQNSNISVITTNLNVTANAASNTGVYEITPSRQNFENEDYLQKSHVYTSTFPVSNMYDNSEVVNNDGLNRDTFSRSRNNFVNVRNDMPPMNSLFAEKPSPLFNRLECPQTPIHPFGMKDCPPNPAHAFGPLETPMTPIPTFGRCDAPMTPVHPFSLDCPPTPNHSFAMGDFSQNQISSQIPPSRYTSFQDNNYKQVNRNSDYNNFLKYDEENDCNEYNERNSLFNSRNYKYDQAQRNYSDNYRHYGRNAMQQSNGRGNQNQFEQCDTRYHDLPRRESSIGRSMSRNYISSRQYSVERKEYRGRDYRYENDSGRTMSDSSYSKSNFNREQSIGRNLQDERTLKSIEFTSNNDLSVESPVGRSIIIDTSVNRSFQELKVPSFDARRRRASSVGRSLISEQYIKSESTNTKYDKRTLSSNTNNFRRARSVGREIAETQERKNFKDIKEELQSYKHKHETLIKNKITNSNKTIISDASKKANERDPRISRRDEYEHRRDKNESRTLKTSTTRTHYRDPRLHSHHSFDSRKKYQEDQRGTSRGTKKHGIVYSADNIAKGKILGSGYGVKNYKIPKIKKVSEEVVNQDLNENDKFSKDKAVDESCNIKIKDDSEKINILKQKQEKKDGKRPTRWSSNEKIVQEVEKSSECLNSIKNYIEVRNEEIISIIIPDSAEKFARTSVQKSVSETNKVKCDSQKVNKIKDIENYSYSENSEIDNITSVAENPLDSKQNEIQEKIFSSEDKSNDIVCNENEKSLTNFQLDYNTSIKDIEEYSGSSSSSNSITVETEDLKIDDTSNTGNDKQSAPAPDDNSHSAELEMFSDHIATDSVVENVNALIADLDDNFVCSKSDNKKQFKQEITFENVMKTRDNITCTDEKSPETHNESKVKETKSDLKDSLDMTLDITNVNDCIRSKENYGILNDNVSFEHRPQPKINSDVSIGNSEVSTTDEENASTELINDQNKQNEDHIESCSTPDSTIEFHENNQDAKIQEGVPDSTNELNCEMSSDITSTHISHESKDNLETNTIQNDNKNDSIGSFLSILKDKSKIKELLTMLQDQSSENYKLKKKLEKLSEIVSDDEDTPSESNIPKGYDSNVTNNIKINDLRESTINEKVHKETDSKPINENFDKKNILEVQNLEKVEELKCKDEIDQQEKCGLPLCPQNDTIEVEPMETNKKTVKDIKVAKKASKDSSSNVTDKPIKKTSRELKQLQDDIKEMFMHDGFTANNTGIRMCRLAKLVEDKTAIEKDDKNNTDSNSVVGEVVSGKIKQSAEESGSKLKITKKKQPSKTKITQKEVLPTIENESKSMAEPKSVAKLRPGPKSKTKLAYSDPYVFESDSFGESYNTTAGDVKYLNSSDSECESLESSNSFGSTELLAEIKKKAKRKRPGWKAGVIKSKHKKKKKDMTNPEIPSTAEHLKMFSDSILDENCFTDIAYCFKKHTTEYSCRFCAYSGNDIVHHYKKQHPHSEIPLSRLSPEVAKAALEQCHGLDFQELRKIPSEKYTCRFCLKEFAKKKNALEAFFWHVVSMHTGEYKQLCSECVNVTRCPFNLDIPAPPKEPKGQLTGYVCCKCNYTQVSLENLKSHVINRHDNIETEVFEINLSLMTKKFLHSLKSSTVEPAPRVLRSTRLNQTIEESSEQSSSNDKKAIDIDKVAFHSEQDLNIKEKRKYKRNKIQSKISFENDDVAKEISQTKEPADVDFDEKRHDSQQDSSNGNGNGNAREAVPNETCSLVRNLTDTNVDCPSTSDDVFDYPHFKVHYTETGTKEYDCCINGVENHFRTPLLISFKKHVQIKHKEKWDGFCYICKLIVTSQGNHYFKDCLQHFLDKHMDNFPVVNAINVSHDGNTNVVEEDKLSATYLNVRPLSELISKSEPQLDETPLPVIESVVSLGSTPGEATQQEEGNRNDIAEVQSEGEYKYEEAQAAVRSRKNHVVLGIMMGREKLVHIFKCAGRFCSYSTDNAEDALRHAVTHERVGGENSLDCTYCDFDSSKNAVELVTHVFKLHGSCPFVCGLCFYRAAASQLVYAHQIRLHKNKRKTIYRSTVTGRTNTNENILPREIAVPLYDCNQDFGACQFKTYTAGKFAEHLQMRHQTDREFSCSVCPAKLMSISDIIQHMKSHGFKVYQCTWCVYGADSETELLSHASERHPNKKPQAYLRIITNKQGTTGYRVLPLAQFNNSKVAAFDIVPNATKGNPEREAERSIDLEKLIGQTTQMVDESIITTGENETDDSTEPNAHSSASGPMEMFDPEPLDQTRESLVMGLQSSLLDQIQEELTANTSPLAVITPIPPSAESPNLKKLIIENPINVNQTSLLNVEPEAKTPEKSSSDVVYCIESDDESPVQNVIDLSTEDVPSTSQTSEKSESVRVPLTRLYKCGLCPNTTLKYAAGFKRHVTAIHHQELDKLTCAYCSFIGERDAIVKHYISEHSLLQDAIKRYLCGVCENKYVAFSFVKKHLKEDHNISKLVVSSKQRSKGEYQFVVNAAPKPNVVKQSVKRKLSGDKNDKASPATKLKKFGLHDIARIPITPILDELVYCALCEFSTKVRLNMVRHLQLHSEQQPVPQTNPVNPVPHLETNEKHFDKMVNLASSSLASRVDKSNKVEHQPVVNPLISPETISRFPKYVPDRQRYTCSAKDCCYTSVDENLFKYHWETLHSEINDYRCIHCPPHQHVNTSKPINAARVISHLKMHDIRLYACSCCSFYHNRRPMVEKHIADSHTSGYVMVVREEGEVVPTTSNISQSVNATPTMDLKPWQCGLCKFKSMLRPEVIDHCAKVHQSKMQYKCTYCAFRTSNMENITKHQSKSHGDRVADTFYFYYREGSIPDDPDGTPLWQKQRQKSGVPETQVKIETIENKELGLQNNSIQTGSPPQPVTIPVVDLNIVKKDPDADFHEHPVPELCKTIGQFCEPNGLKYKCPLCEIVSEESKEAMQSHLYEELQYRKWACGFCSYKAFHKNGLKEHMNTEHRQYRDPIELPVDSRVEIWIAKALDHQFLLIEKNRQNMARQTVVNPNTVPTLEQAVPAVTSESGDEYSAESLQNMFGSFGQPEGMQFSCPKCNYKNIEKTVMRDHLEMELHKIRWCCNSCTLKFQNYHEAQYHCKSAHEGVAARAVEAARDAGKRAAWVSAVLRTQRLSMATSSESRPAEASDGIERPEQGTASDNSLLVVRYEKRVHTPENVNAVKVHSNDSDEDEQRLVIDERSKVDEVRQCIFCTFKCTELKDFKEHINQHTNIKPYFCLYCDLNGHRKTLLKHLSDVHVHTGQPTLLITKGQRGLGGPLMTSGTAPASTSGPPIDDDKLICLRCEKSFTDNDAKMHFHANVTPQFAKKSDVVVKCCVCQRLHQDIEAATAHHKVCHPDKSLNYAYYKLQSTKRSVYCCAYCDQQFKFRRDFKVHCKAIHSSLPLQFNKRNFSYRVTSGSGSDLSSINLSDVDKKLKRKCESHSEEPAPKMCARKSTSKLPVQCVAKKSTAKLPFTRPIERDQEEYCYYGSKPCLDNLDNVRTRMAFGNTDISITYKQLTEVIKIDPLVLVKDVTK